ncbi:MAG: ISLre2 family transposase, partial [Lachnospiraceae bacterium]|nr:ISLre2 family transposase [Lachnospiraceae bacterium]MCI6977668.1 ISLre2 family transposase [Lachnospiraceae bacterium]
GIIDFVRYSREHRLLEATGTEDIPVQEISTGEIIAEHYDQSRSYIERIQARMPGLTSRKILRIRNHLSGL